MKSSDQAVEPKEILQIHAKAAQYKEVLRLFGPIDDHRVLEIIDLHPSSIDLEIAGAYLADLTDVMGKERQPLSGGAAIIYEIVTRDESFPEEDGPE
jgi:hypothetical protein